MSVRPFSFLLALKLFSALYSFPQAGSISLDWRCSPEHVTLLPSGPYTTVILDEGCEINERPGFPALPARCVYLLIPPGARPKALNIVPLNILEIGVNKTVVPIQPKRPTNDPPIPFVHSDPAIYSSDLPFPREWGGILGTHRLHGYTLVSVLLNPIRYIPSRGELFLATHLAVTLSFEDNPAPPARAFRGDGKRARKEVAGMVHNWQDVDRFAPAGREIKLLNGEEYPYLLITGKSLTAAFQPLADRRTAQGRNGIIVNVEDISSTYTGTDMPDKIRNCIRDYYTNHGTEFVTLGGDDTVVPVRYCLAGNVDTMIPTDMYFTGLDGTWDADGDGIYGRYDTDEPDLLPEVWIGRIPVRTPEQASGYLGKLVAYETADPSGYSGSMLVTGEGLDYLSGLSRPLDFRDHDPVSNAEFRVERNIQYDLHPYWQPCPLDRFFDTRTTWDTNVCGDYMQSRDHYIERLSWGYHFVYNLSHGTGGAWVGESDWVDTGIAMSLTNKYRPSIFFVISCYTNAFDESDPCLSEAFIRNPNGGAVAYVAASRTEIIAPFVNEFFREMFGNRRSTMGEVFGYYKMDYAHYHTDKNYFQYVRNVMADSALVLHNQESGRHLQVAFPNGCEQINVADGIFIRWNASGSDLGATETIRLEYSPDSGSSWLPISGAETLGWQNGIFRWIHPNLPLGDHYRIRATLLQDAAVSDTSDRDFHVVGPVHILTVKATPLNWVWIDGTHRNWTDYTYSVVVGTTVTLISSIQENNNFEGWYDGNDVLQTRQRTHSFLFQGDTTRIAKYTEVGSLRDYYVNDDTPESGFAAGNDENDGRSPDHPLRHIREIFDRYTDVGTLFVSEGTFFENVRTAKGAVINGAGQGKTIWDGGGRGVCLMIDGTNTGTLKGVTLRHGNGGDQAGGFVGWNAHWTLEDCEITSNTGRRGGGLYFGYLGEPILINCSVHHNVSGWDGGGGLLDNVSSVFVRNCEVFNNRAEGSWGGGLRVYCPGTMLFQGNRFEQNWANSYGGALETSGNTLILEDNSFIRNSSNFQGGAAMASGTHQVIIERNIFTGNTALQDGGGVLGFRNNSFMLAENTFQNNMASGVGGAVLADENNHVEFRGNLFQDNHARINGGALNSSTNGITILEQNIFEANTTQGNGGAAYGYNNGIYLLADNTFQHNEASSLGGAVTATENNRVELYGNNFENNKTNGNGGALNVYSNASTVLEQNILENNSAQGMGGGLLLYNQSAEISDCKFDGNRSESRGGAIMAQSCSRITVNESDFTGNQSVLWGGALNFDACTTIVLANSLFGRNSAQRNGGAMDLFNIESFASINNALLNNRSEADGGAIQLGEIDKGIIENNIMTGNYARGNAGALGLFRGATTVVYNCTLSSNTTEVQGGGICIHNSDANVWNSILWDNSPQQIHCYSGSSTVQYSDVQGGATGAGNISEDPLFINPSQGNYELQSLSPCIDAADGNHAPENDLLDRLRWDEPETPNTGVGYPDYADMGAYEYKGVVQTPTPSPTPSPSISPTPSISPSPSPSISPTASPSVSPTPSPSVSPTPSPSISPTPTAIPTPTEDMSCWMIY